MVRLLTNDLVSNVLIILQKEKRSLNKLKHWYVQATMSSLHWESHCIFNLLKFLKWVHHIIMPTLLDYLWVTQIWSQSPTLPYGWPELLDKRKFGSVAHKKLRFKLRMFQNSKLLVLLFQFLASFSCSSCFSSCFLLFLLFFLKMHVVHCKQLYKQEPNWMSMQQIEVPDR